eukprot:m.698567 g.698567  ORF g.698567 m.698567 type:complete len:625 (-) comp22902_c0_seq9:503-2377(-)
MAMFSRLLSGRTVQCIAAGASATTLAYVLDGSNDDLVRLARFPRLHVVMEPNTRGDGIETFHRAKSTLPRWAGPEPRPGEPKYTRADVSKHDGSGPDKSLWVTYRNGVYDVTEFQHEHPGGHYITQAAGGAVDGFWQIWAYHHLSPKVPRYLESLRIGELADWSPDDEDLDGDVYASEPHTRRGPAQHVFFPQPWCTETKSPDLSRSYLTPVDDFYVRNHAPVPVVSSETAETDYDIDFCLDTSAADGEQIVASFSLSTLKEMYPSITVTSIVQCAGNRAAQCIDEFGDASGFAGTPFADIGVGMLGNAQWEGIRLSDILRDMYGQRALSEDGSKKLHVEFEGLDGYSTSTPLSTVLQRDNDCILATGMNGVPLPPDHGYPVRALLPGIAGARNVKWLSKISITEKESDSPWQSKYYKVGPVTNKTSAHELPLQSIILDPTPAAEVSLSTDGTVNVEGVAYSGGSGNRITTVEVSGDNGLTWTAAAIRDEEVIKDDSSRHHGWVRWAATCPLSVQLPPQSPPQVMQSDTPISSTPADTPAEQTGTDETPQVADADGCAARDVEMPTETSVINASQVESLEQPATATAVVLCRATDDGGVVQPVVGECNNGYIFNGYHKVEVVVV